MTHKIKASLLIVTLGLIGINCAATKAHAGIKAEISDLGLIKEVTVDGKICIKDMGLLIVKPDWKGYYGDQKSSQLTQAVITHKDNKSRIFKGTFGKGEKVIDFEQVVEHMPTEIKITYTLKPKVSIPIQNVLLYASLPVEGVAGSANWFIKSKKGKLRKSSFPLKNPGYHILAKGGGDIDWVGWTLKNGPGLKITGSAKEFYIRDNRKSGVQKFVFFWYITPPKKKDMSPAETIKFTVILSPLLLEEKEAKKTSGDTTTKMEIAAGYTPQAPTIDGKLDDPAWQNAGKTSPFIMLGTGGEIAGIQTKGQLTYDHDNLYIAFLCHEPKPKALRARCQTDGFIGIFQDDIVEVFLAKSGAHKGYYHLAVNSSGAGYGMYFPEETEKWNYCWFDYPNKTRANKSLNLKWEKKTSLCKEGWIVEIKIPFADLGGRPEDGEVWRLNLCRERKVGKNNKNYSWASLSGKTFHAPAEFGYLLFGKRKTPKPKLVKGTSAPSPSTVYPVIIPCPQSIKWTKERFLVDSETVIVVPDNMFKKHPISVSILQKDLKELYAYRTEVMPLSKVKREKNIIIITDKPNEFLLKELSQKHNLSVSTENPRPEGYRLVVSKDIVLIVGSDQRGMLYGVQTLRQLLQKRSGKITIPGVIIDDYPDLKWRAMHFFLPWIKFDPIYLKGIVDILARLKINTIIIEHNQNFPWESHPVLAHKDAPSKEELKEFIAYAKRHYIEVIPQVQTLGHFEWVLNHKEYQHLNEDPNSNSKLKNYCTSNPETYKLLFDLIDETIKLYKPKYFHIGHDELLFAPFAVCPRCKNKAAWQHFAEDTKKLHGYLAKRGIRTRKLSDMLLLPHGGPPLNITKAIEAIPKDIIIADWHYGLRGRGNDIQEGEFPSLEFLKRKGFPVLATGWVKPKNIYYFTLAAKKNQVSGFSGSTWYGIYPGTCPEQLQAILLTGEYSWSPGKPKLQNINYSPLNEFRKRFPGTVKKYLPIDKTDDFYVVDLTRYCNRSLGGESGRDWLGYGCDYDMRNLPTGLQWFAGIPFKIGTDCIILKDKQASPSDFPREIKGIPFGQKVRGLIFLHTASRPKVEKKGKFISQIRKPCIGQYLIHYSDGSSESIILSYTQNIISWNSKVGTLYAHTAWKGKTKGGADAIVTAYEWQNPHPDKQIDCIDFISMVSECKPILIGLTGRK